MTECLEFHCTDKCQFMQCMSLQHVREDPIVAFDWNWALGHKEQYIHHIKTSIKTSYENFKYPSVLVADFEEFLYTVIHFNVSSQTFMGEHIFLIFNYLHNKMENIKCCALMHRINTIL